MTTDAKKLVERRLRSYFKQASAKLQTDDARQLLAYAEQVILRAGKRARPKLLYLTYEGYGGTTPEILIDIATALELHHQFLLIHDDVMDEDYVRYDGPNLAGLYRQDGLSGHTANSMAILAGNLLFSFADQIILDSSHLTSDQKVAVLKLLHHTNSLVQQGQQLDIRNVIGDKPVTTEAELLQIASLKTAAYTVHLPMQIAAELLDLPKPERKKIADFAEAFGILYQLVDDYSDYFQNESSMNDHPKFRDFQQGKVTYPLWALLLLKNKSNPKLFDESECLLKKKELSTNGRQILKELSKYNIKEQTETKIVCYSTLLRVIIKELMVSDSAQKIFQMMINQYITNVITVLHPKVVLR